MKAKNEIRASWLKLRVSPAEREAIIAKAEAQGQTVADFLRQRALGLPPAANIAGKRTAPALGPHGSKFESACPLGKHLQKPGRSAASADLSGQSGAGLAGSTCGHGGRFMYMKVFPHGQGDGDMPTRYLVRPDYPGRKDAPPEILRGERGKAPHQGRNWIGVGFSWTPK
jgi:hypothetical protein